MVAVQPDTQIVLPIVAWVTAGLVAPGVIVRLGSPGRRTDAPGVAAGVGFALGFALVPTATFGAIVLDAVRVGPAGGVSVGVTSSVGLGASVSAGAVGVVTAAGTRV